MRKCPAKMVNLVSKKPDNTFLADLTFAQTYKLEKLLGTIVNKARQLRLCDFKNHEMYDIMDPHINQQIAEGIIERLERNQRNVKSLQQSFFR